MNARQGVLSVLGAMLLALAPVQAQVTSAPSFPATAKVDFEKFSGKLKFVGNVDYSIDNLARTARIAFDNLQNQSEFNTAKVFAVYLVLTEAPVTFGDSFAGWFIAGLVSTAPLEPGASVLHENTVSDLLVQPPDGVYYATMGAYESGPGCGAEFCYDDLRGFAARVLIYQGSYYVYGGPPVPGTEATAVEFFHAAMGHYFVSAQADEVAALDAGLFEGWTRTGESFVVWTDGTGLFDVCRFFTTYFAPKSSHVYTANATECQWLKSSAIWQYEKLAYKVALPTSGACPVGIPLYRLFNNGMTGAPNHRYTTKPAKRAELIAQGFTPEDDNIVCVAR